MMPKEKAQELVSKYEQHKGIKRNLAKQFALIAVDEIIDYLIPPTDIEAGLSSIAYWWQVKSEINKL
jgi:hypothetical protein